jgi:hypothetical protein
VSRVYVNWKGLPEEANTTEYVVNVKRQGNWEFVLEQFKAAKVEADKVRSLFIIFCFFAVSARKLILLSQFPTFRRFGAFAPF